MFDIISKIFRLKFISFEKRNFEKIEYNEYLCLLENGHKIRATHVAIEVVSVDIIEDLKLVRRQIPKNRWFSQHA